MFSSVALRGSHSVDTLAKPGKLCREVAFEGPEISSAWVENTNICCRVQERLDFLEIEELCDSGPISADTGGLQGHTFLTASGNSLQRILLKKTFIPFLKYIFKHFTCLFYKGKISTRDPNQFSGGKCVCWRITGTILCDRTLNTEGPTLRQLFKFCLGSVYLWCTLMGLSKTWKITVFSPQIYHSHL